MKKKKKRNSQSDFFERDPCPQTFPRLAFQFQLTPSQPKTHSVFKSSRKVSLSESQFYQFIRERFSRHRFDSLVELELNSLREKLSDGMSLIKPPQCSLHDRNLSKCILQFNLHHRQVFLVLNILSFSFSSISFVLHQLRTVMNNNENERK